MGAALQRDRTRHLVRELPFCDWLAREFPRRRLFTYFHRIHGNWMIAEWLGDGTSYFREWLFVGPDPQMFGRAEAAVLRSRLAIDDEEQRRANKRFVLSQHNSDLERATAENAELEDVAKHMVRHGADGQLVRGWAGLDAP